MAGSILVANPLPSPPLQSPVTPSTPGPTAHRDGKSPPPARRRGTVACRRCRRLRTKCVHGPECQAPCEACRSAGPSTAADCTFPRRGEKDVDRDFRRRPPTQRLSISSSSSSRGTPSLNHSLAPAVQPLPTGQSVPVDAPLLGSLSTSAHASNSQHHHHSASASSASALPPATRVQFGNAHQSINHRRLGLTVNTGSNAFFPPHEEIVAGCRVFVTSYFQLGFLPKTIFLDSITRNVNSVSPFLLSSILSISARFTPSLIRRYGSSSAATENFLQIARTMAATEMYKPSLDRAQGFFLLAISEWGNGEKERSSMDMGVAVRMSSILKLHREETYALPPGAPAEHVIRAESARRTFWMIHSQENLQAGYSSPAPFPLDDLTARLPCDEHDFAFGIHPAPRSVLAGTLPAEQQPDAANSKHRCLFATLIQSHNLWGQVARRACRSDLKTNGAQPWEPGSEYQTLTQALRTFEDEMPDRHRWSLWNLRGWKAEQMHLSYLAVVMVLRVSNIVERRIYLDEILFSINHPHAHDSISPKTKAAAPDHFWQTMADELFSNVYELHEQIDAFYSSRTRDEGFPAILVFCVYICGSLASYLWRYPQLCPRVARKAEEMSLRSLQVLGHLHKAWPTSTRWNQGLQQIASPISSVAGSQSGSNAGDSPPMTSSSSSLSSCDASIRSGYSLSAAAAAAAEKERTAAHGFVDAAMLTELSRASEDFAIDPRLAGVSAPNETPSGLEDSVGADAFWKANETPAVTAPPADPEALSNELFEAEMSTLLSGDADFGWLDFERGA